MTIIACIEYLQTESFGTLLYSAKCTKHFLKMLLCITLQLPIARVSKFYR